jgi:WD40 repeat protein
MTFAGHEQAVRACDYSPNGLYVISASYDGTLKLWDAETGEDLVTFRGHEGAVYDCAFSPDGRLVVSAGQDRTVRIWDVTGRREPGIFRGHEYLVEACTFTFDGNQAISEDQDHVLKLWDVESGNELASVKAERRQFKTTNLTPDLRLRVCGPEEEQFIVFEQRLAEGATHVFTLHKTTASSPDDRHLLSLGPEAIRMWDATSGSKLSGTKAHPGGAKVCAFSRSGKYIASGGADHTIIIWDAEPKTQELAPEVKAIWAGPPPVTLEELSKLQGHADGVTDCVFSPDNQRILSSSWDGTLKVWDATPKQAAEPAHRGEVRNCVLSASKPELITGGDDTFKIWDTSSATVIASVDPPTTGYQISYSADGSRIVCLGDGAARVYDAQKLKEIARIPDQSLLQLSPDGELALSYGREDRTVQVWKISSGKILTTLRDVINATFSPDGKQIATASKTAVKLWDARKGKQRASFSYLRGSNDDAYRSMFTTPKCSFSADGKWLAATDECVIKLWNLTTGEESWLPGEFLTINLLCFAPDNRRLITSGIDSIVRLWDVERRIQLANIEDQTLAAWSPDGCFLITGNSKGALNMYESSSGRRLREMPGHLGAITRISFRGNRQLISTSQDQLRLWDITTGQCLVTFYSDASITTLDHRENVFAFGTTQGDVSILHLENHTP